MTGGFFASREDPELRPDAQSQHRTPAWTNDINRCAVLLCSPALPSASGNSQYDGEAELFAERLRLSVRPFIGIRFSVNDGSAIPWSSHPTTIDDRTRYGIRSAFRGSQMNPLERADSMEAARRIVARTRREQNLPETITDPAVLARLAVLFPCIGPGNGRSNHARVVLD